MIYVRKTLRKIIFVLIKMIHKCLRCGYSDNQKCNIKRHLKRKNICHPLLTNINRENCLKLLDVKEQFILDLILNNNKIDTHILQENEQLKQKLKQKFVEPEKHENIYIIQPRSCVETNTPVYKIGRTKNVNVRFKRYAKIFISLYKFKRG